jgi:hypothetical protein
MSDDAGFPHAIAVGLGLIFSFALSLLVLIAFGGMSLFLAERELDTRARDAAPYHLSRGSQSATAHTAKTTKRRLRHNQELSQDCP